MSQNSLRRGFVTVGGRREVHYRRGGNGPTVVLLHESPLSSQSLVVLGTALAQRFDVIALDTPGYGSSDGLADIDQPEIPDYAEATAEAIQALGVETCAVYGAHTGASIAVQLASTRTDLVAAAILDGLPVFTEEESTWILENYLPLFPPREDGGHLLTLWARYRDQHVYFPWFDRRLASRMDIGMPSARHLHDGFMDLLRAGEGYRVAYAAAFRYVPTKALAALTVPTAIIAREDDLISSQLDRIGETPECVHQALLPRGRDAWLEAISAHIAAHVEPRLRPPEPGWEPIDGRITRRYADTSLGQLHVRGRPGTDARPMVLFHASPGSARMLEALTRELMKTGPVLAFDTLGNGESDKPPGWERPRSWDSTGVREPAGQETPPTPWDRPSIGDYAGIMVEAIDALGFEHVDLYGSHTGGSIAIEVAIALGPERAPHVIIDGLALFTEDDRAELLTHYTAPLEPHWDGSHLPRAWGFLRAQTEFWPWYNQTREGIRWVESLPAEAMHTWVVELLKSGHTYPLAYNAAFAYDGEERLPMLESKLLIVAEEDDMLAPCSEVGVQLAPNGIARDLPDTMAGAAALYRRFVAGDDI